MPANIDPDICNAIGTVLAETDNHQPPTARTLHLWAQPYPRTPASVADVQRHVNHLEARGDIQRHADPDNPTILSYSLTEAGRRRFA